MRSNGALCSRQRILDLFDLLLLRDSCDAAINETVCGHLALKCQVAGLHKLVPKLVALVVAGYELDEVVDLVPLRIEEVAAQLRIDLIPIVVQLIERLLEVRVPEAAAQSSDLTIAAV